MKNTMLSVNLIIAACLILTSCGGRSSQTDIPALGSELVVTEERAFFNNLAAHCGESFEGEQTFLAEGRESWEDKDFIMHVTICEDDRIYVPFHLSDDHSRTWMFLVEDGRLRFRHDHRHEDGTPEEVTMYGGYADGEGTHYRQDFPADEYTCEMLPTACNAVWRVELTEDPPAFSYSLFDDGELLFSATFDLSEPL